MKNFSVYAIAILANGLSLSCGKAKTIQQKDTNETSDSKFNLTTLDRSDLPPCKLQLKGALAWVAVEKVFVFCNGQVWSNVQLSEPAVAGPEGKVGASGPEGKMGPQGLSGIASDGAAVNCFSDFDPDPQFQNGHTRHINLNFAVPDLELASISQSNFLAKIGDTIIEVPWRYNTSESRLTLSPKNKETAVVDFAIAGLKDSLGRLCENLNFKVQMRGAAKGVFAGYLAIWTVTQNGDLFASGANSYGALGTGTWASNLSLPNPVFLGQGRSVKSLRNGGFSTCAILDNDNLKCWGNNDGGQLGVGDTVSRSVPALVDVGAGRSVKAVSLNGSSTCAILDNDSLKCWGYNEYGKLGVGDTVSRSVPTLVDVGTGRTVKAISLNGGSTCAILDNDSLKCWGINQYGQLGVGDTVSRSVPTLVDVGPGRTVKSISLNGSYTCAILDNDSLKCWGYDQTINTNRLLPTQADIGFGRTLKEISKNGASFCVILDNDSLKCGPSGFNISPVDFGVGRTVNAIIMEGSNTCASLDDSSVRCWGNNANGQLGKGDTVDSLVPIEM